MRYIMDGMTEIMNLGMNDTICQQLAFYTNSSFILDDNVEDIVIEDTVYSIMFILFTLL